MLILFSLQLHKPTDLPNGNKTKVNVRLEGDHTYKQMYLDIVCPSFVTNSNSDPFS